MKTWVTLPLLFFVLQGISYSNNDIKPASVSECNEIVHSLSDFEFYPDAYPVEADIDNDGDMDMIVGTDGELFFLENLGEGNYINQTGFAVDFLPDLNFLDMNISFVDLDSDGDLDISIVGNEITNKHFYWNTGTASEPNFTQAGSAGTDQNPISQFDLSELDGGFRVGFADASIYWVDLDNDNDYDAVVGGKTGWFLYYENIGSPKSPLFERKTQDENPFNLFRTEGEDEGTGMQYESSPYFIDWDSDGDFDMFSSSQLGRIQYFENTGFFGQPTFTERFGVDNPLDNIALLEDSHILITDIDCDGDWDLVSGSETSPGQSRILICDLPHQVTKLNSTVVLNLDNYQATLHGSPVNLSTSLNGGDFYGIGVIGNQFLPRVAGVGTHIVSYISQTDMGCEIIRRANIDVRASNNLAIEGVVGDLTCNLANSNQQYDGHIDITASGGTSPYIYSWRTLDGFGLIANQEDQSGLSPGTYTVEVEDAEGVVEVSTFTVAQPEPISILASTTGVRCIHSANGIIDVNAIGGNVVGDYTYTWSTTNGGGLVQGASFQDGLVSGTYTVEVADNNGCSQSATYTIAIDPQLQVVHRGVTLCSGDLHGEEPGVYTFIATDEHGCTYTEVLTIVELPQTPDIVEQITIRENQLPYEWNNQLYTAAGSYTNYLSDSNGCGFQETLVLKVISAPRPVPGPRPSYFAYPNPAQNILFVNSETSQNLKMIDHLGRIVIDTNLHPGLNSVNTSSMTNGMYLMKLSNGDEIQTERVLVQN